MLAEHAQRVIVGSVGGLRFTRCILRIEQVVVIVALLDHPNDDEDDDVQKVLLQEEVPYGSTDPRPVQPTITVDGGVDGHDDVE